MSRINIDPLLEGVLTFHFGVLEPMAEHFLGLAFQQCVGCFSCNACGFQRVFEVHVVVVQFNGPLILIVTHQRAAWLYDQFARTQGGIGFTVRNVDDDLMHAPLFRLRLELHRLCWHFSQSGFQ
ncbi:hypothetical protein [Candidatus Villigracilis affinis]|uniref:hypothetical protein n=1 Tax=Candidatus Villigracilis affinis TaxID=3140682 RepID=UPI001D7B7C10|nr:hypothetical protein [Anaerolineales bacterium]